MSDHYNIKCVYWESFYVNFINMCEKISQTKHLNKNQEWEINLSFFLHNVLLMHDLFPI